MRCARVFLVILISMICSFPVQLSAQPLAQGKDKFLGAGTSSPVGRFFSKCWNQVTPGNAGKWGSVSSARGQYNWTNLDTIYNYAVQRGLLYKHHTLVWGSQQPSWIDGLDPASQRAEVENWIRLVVQRYPKMDYIDVVNEPLHTPLPSYKNALGGDGTTGWDWVITAFQWARQYCAPGMKLILNEYNVLGSTTNTDNFLSIINLLKDRNLIDGIGVQGHYFEFRSHIGTSGGYVYNPSDIKNNLNRLTATGLPVYMTEFDIDESVDSDQLAQYKIYFPIFWGNPGVKGITYWGYIEDDVWTAHPDTYLLRADGRERPALQWLRTYVEIPLPPSLVSPVAVTGAPRNPLLVWRSSALATSYHVQVSENRTFVGFAADTTVADTSFQLKPLATNTTYYWRVSAVNSVGGSDYSTMVGFTTADFISAVESESDIPAQFGLSQNYPNPFNPSTIFEFQVSSSEFVVLNVLDVLGREVATLVKENRQPGIYSVHWNASGLPSGVYFCRMQAGGFVATKKMILSK
jgi:endo-1,4-beta-xylanase